MTLTPNDEGRSDKRGSALDYLEKLVQGGNDKIARPHVGSFREFLLTQARVKMQDGSYGPYTLKGREALGEIIDTFDLVIGSYTGKILKDATIDLCGGAQFGKTVLALNFGAYLTGCLGRNWGYYLPDDDLVEGIVDGKFRPDVVDQIEWFAASISVGKTLNKSGKSVNKKGAFLVTDGKRTAMGMVRGMGKIPTSFSMDVVQEDEKDDIPAKRAKFLKGRMTASDLRLKCSIGTQRIHGAGQQKQFDDGSQHVMLVRNDVTGTRYNPEENWPQICRVALTGTPRLDDPQLTVEGNFKRAGSTEVLATYDPEDHYYFADPLTGDVLNREVIYWEARRPEQIKLRKWSFRISQLGTSAIDLVQIVSAWAEAVQDPEKMVVFCCDVLAMPKSLSQALSPFILTRSREMEAFDLRPSFKAGCHGVGGLDFGDICHFISREIESQSIKRIVYAEQIASSRVVSRAVELFFQMKMSALFVDAAPLRDQARAIIMGINGIDPAYTFPQNLTDADRIHFPSGLVWDGENKRWRNLKGACVEFTLKPGEGTQHKLGRYDENGRTIYYPVIRANRYDCISRVINEFLTYQEGVIRVVNGELLKNPIMRLPTKTASSPAVIELIDNHFITGSKRDRDKNDQLADFIDNCENHLLLANAYSSLAENECPRSAVAKFAYTRVDTGAALRVPTKGLAI